MPIGRCFSFASKLQGDNMIEVMLMFVLGLVIYNSKLWEEGMWETTKSKWVYWRSK